MLSLSYWVSEIIHCFVIFTESLDISQPYHRRTICQSWLSSLLSALPCYFCFPLCACPTLSIVFFSCLFSSRLFPMFPRLPHLYIPVFCFESFFAESLSNFAFCVFLFLPLGFFCVCKVKFFSLVLSLWGFSAPLCFLFALLGFKVWYSTFF